ncbi:hypothetical protein NQU59_05020 [Acinetobacter colistiniresistens]|uniref:hypothetical protein n=1 Tax=Acinetobacter colistiniresistens TaxID=280145 RepID=UPI00211CBA96|nr:hypothetical protein [Acinetobacter colistiniresistens]UUM28471.1 hypothetical protein NQU59_05020 [Acinetobacter colistiniresistens]
MGIDSQNFNFLKYVQKNKVTFGRTITLGRLALFNIEDTIFERYAIEDQKYAEQLLEKLFGASSIESIDNSGYENSTYIFDMNKDLIDFKNYDTVIDFGCTEHIYNIGNCFNNIRKLCDVGGVILHAVPSNGCCGHGFYQFSPEFFIACIQKKMVFRILKFI